MYLVQNSFLLVLVKPEIIREPEDSTVQSGETATFSCSASGDPSPAISWHREDPDDDPSGLGRRRQHQPRASVEGRSGRLRVEAATAADEGVYVCVAENEAGRAEASATLSVHGEALETYTNVFLVV